MAITMGIENKKQVYLAGTLLTLLVAIGSWELYDTLSGSPTSTGRKETTTVAGAKGSFNGRAGAPSTQPDHGRLGVTGSGSSDLGLTLQIERLNLSEQVDHSGASRNIFDVESVPAPIENPIASARPVESAPAPVAVFKPPAIDLKYLGYAQNKDASFGALFVRGNETFLAKTGEIMYHRYKVGTIDPASVQVTDLRYNSTQKITLTAN